MKLNSTLQASKTFIAFLFLFAGFTRSYNSTAQISLVCTNPTNVIYGLTGNGQIQEINVNTGVTGAIVKNTTYLGNSPSNANGLGYNIMNGKFYYFKRNVTSGPQEFVSFTPSLGIVTPLASSTCTNDVHTGCVNFTGTGYYTIDIDGNLNYYNILTNKWTLITSNLTDQYNTDVDSVIRVQSAGDMAIDGYGAIWLVTSSNSNYALYKFSAPLPTTAVASLKVTCVIQPTAATPTGKSFAGIAFNPSGQIYMATKTGDQLYRLNNNYSLSLIGTMTTSDIGNDLTSCNFPSLVLPVTWKSFDVSSQKNNVVSLNWEIMEEDNDGFYVQYSTDGSNWDNLTFIPSKGINDVLNSYSYSYVNNHNGTQYYRLLMVSKESRNDYSDIKTLTLKNDQQIVSIWPNPTTDQVRIGNEPGNNVSLIQAEVFDLSGRILTTKKLQAASTNTISIGALPTGTYIIRVEDMNGKYYNQKISKQ